MQFHVSKSAQRARCLACAGREVRWEFAGMVPSPRPVEATVRVNASDRHVYKTTLFGQDFEPVFEKLGYLDVLSRFDWICPVLKINSVF